MRADTVQIRTAEGIEFSLPLAGPFSRMLALAVDLAVIVAAGSALRYVISLFQLASADAAQAILVVSYFVISMLYGILTEWSWRGQTIGKRLLQLRVVEASGLHLQPSQIIVRNLLRAVDLLPGLYLFGGICCVLNSKRQRLGDIAAETIVIRIPQAMRAEVNQLLSRKFNSLAESPFLAARLRQKVPLPIAQLALQAVLRRDAVQPAARVTLFRDFATYFKRVVPYPDEVAEQLTDEQYVRNVVDVLFRQTSKSDIQTVSAMILNAIRRDASSQNGREVGR